jgi:hypothetical protein
MVVNFLAWYCQVEAIIFCLTPGYITVVASKKHSVELSGKGIFLLWRFLVAI